MNEVKVEIGQFRPVDKGALRGFFTLIIHPYAQKIIDCRYFATADKRWFSFPQKEITYKDGRKTEYIPIISYFNREYLDGLKAAVLEAIKNMQPQETNGQQQYQQKNQSQSYSKQPSHPLSPETSSDWGELPF